MRYKEENLHYERGEALEENSQRSRGYPIPGMFRQPDNSEISNLSHPWVQIFPLLSRNSQFGSRAEYLLTLFSFLRVLKIYRGIKSILKQNTKILFSFMGSPRHEILTKAFCS